MDKNKDLSNALRALSMDSVQKANSGHPGAPMGMADIASVLWRKFLKHNPKNPFWANRDRFILSNGHASILLYSLLHLTGYDVSILDLKNFRQLNSKTPGHPEYSHTPGVETTTGPLGQGLAVGVGMALSEKTFGSYFNRPNFKIVDHYTYVFVGDGCLMEGISHECCSLAGTWKLGKLIVFYDKNDISIDGKTKNWFSDNTEKRFKAYNWHVISEVDGHNINSISKAIKKCQSVLDKPSIIICRTIIGFGSPNKSGTEQSHGAPLGENEILLTKKKLNWKYDKFEIPKHVYKLWDFTKKGKILEKKWNKKFSDYCLKYPYLSKEYIRRIKGNFPLDWKLKFEKLIKFFNKSHENYSTRKISQDILEFISPIFPELFGGSADLAPSNLTQWSGSKPIHKYSSGNYIHYGVREFGMTAIANGISQYKGFIPFTATFLIFSEYSRNAVRMASLMKIRHIFIYTHDSIGLGEDGPTHQPVEQISTLRLTPNLSVWRPADALETAVSWKYALEKKNGPTALVLSRQDLCCFSKFKRRYKDIALGAYILKDFVNNKTLDIIFIATGSELKLAFLVAQKMSNMGYFTRVVSMPSTDVFDSQNKSYKEKILPSKIKNRVAIEASTSDFWYKYVGLQGKIIGMNTFGESAPAKDLFIRYGFTLENILKKSLALIKKNNILKK
ncbi:transketolase [Buchnera aphidicola]|uniref:transketolase n=1 Tax=Buchnera aphidicola TaxID=9 RepID=UPI0030EB6A8B